MPRSRPASARATAISEFPSVVELPKQRRAQDVLDRLVSASRALLAERDFDAIAVADIAEHAGVSVGVFYTRFATKEHLLAHLARELSATLQVRVHEVLSPDRTATMSLEEIADCYFTLAVDNFVQHRAVLRPLSLIVRLEAHRELRDLTTVFNAGIHQRLSDAMLQHRRRIKHADAEGAVGFAILAASAALREVVLYNEPVSRLSRKRQRIARDAARLCVAYLTSDVPDAG